MASGTSNEGTIPPIPSVPLPRVIRRPQSPPAARTSGRRAPLSARSFLDDRPELAPPLNGPARALTPNPLARTPASPARRARPSVARQPPPELRARASLFSARSLITRRHPSSRSTKRESWRGRRTRVGEWRVVVTVTGRGARCGGEGGHTCRRPCSWGERRRVSRAAACLGRRPHPPAVKAGRALGGSRSSEAVYCSLVPSTARPLLAGRIVFSVLAGACQF